MNKQANSWRLKEHLNSFLKLVTFQNNIINVYLNLCVHQCLVSFVEKQHLCTPLICLADCSIPILLFFFFFALYLLCYSLFYLIISFSIVILFLFVFIFTFILFSFFFSCSYLSVPVFILSLYHLILATILAPFCNFFFGVSFTQLLLWKRLMVHYHIQCGLYIVFVDHTRIYWISLFIIII